MTLHYVNTNGQQITEKEWIGWNNLRREWWKSVIRRYPLAWVTV